MAWKPDLVTCAQARRPEEGRREMPFDLSRIGHSLRETREKRGLTFDEVSDALFIRKGAIRAIEEGDWSNLPHPVYVKGYVTHYATFLKIANPFENGMVSREDELAPEDASKRKNGILKVWRFGRNGQAKTPAWSAVDQL